MLHFFLVNYVYLFLHIYPIPYSNTLLIIGGVFSRINPYEVRDHGDFHPPPPMLTTLGLHCSC